MKTPPSSSLCQRSVRRQIPAILASGIIALSAPVLHAATFTWLDTNAGDVLWSAGVWTPATPTSASSLATTDLVFNGAGATQYTATNDLPAPFLLNTLTLNSSASVAETIAGGGLDFRTDDVAAGILQGGSGAFTIGSDIVISNPLTLSGTGTGVVTLNGVLSGTGAINVTAGTWQVGNVGNSFSGALTIGTGALVEVLPSGLDPQAVNLTAANPGILSNSPVTINGGTLKITTKGASGNGSGITIGGRIITFGPNGGAFDLRNTSGTLGAQGGGILTAGGGDLNLVLNNTVGNPAVVFFNGGQNGHSTGSATDGNWSVGNNTLRIASLNGTGSVRFEITNGAMLTQNLAASNVPVTVRGVLGGDPTSGPTGALNPGISTSLGRIAINTNVATFSQGLRLEDAIQIHSPGASRAIDGNIVIAGSAGGHPGYVVFNGRSTGTALGAAINAPGANVANQNPLWIGQGQNDTLTIENGGIAVFDLRIRYEQGNNNGVVLDGRAVVNAGGVLRFAQSLSNTSFDTTGLNAPNTTTNVGDHVIRGDIEGQGSTAVEAIVDIQLPAPTAAGGAGVPAILTGAPAAGARPLGGLRFEDTTGSADLIINGTGFGGLRITATPRPDRLFSPAGPDPVTNASKINDALPGFRLARLTGSGGYLTLAPANETYTFPNAEWAVGVPVGLRVANHNAAGVDVQFDAGKSTWEHNLAVDADAQLFTGVAPFTQTGGTLLGTGMVLGLSGFTIATNATVSPGFGVGLLTISENLTLNGTFFAELASTTSDRLAVTGNLAVGGALALGGTFGTTDLIIATYTGTLTGTFSTITGLNPEFTVNYGTGTNSNIRLVYTPAPISVWNGNLSGTWSTNAADQNWKGPTTYIQSNSAVFDDTAAGPNLTVTVAGGNVTPSVITVNNSTKNYTLVSSAGAAITGDGKLVKTGIASLTLSGPASYTGGTQINAGTLLLGSNNALPDVGDVTIATGATLNIQGNSDTVPTLNVNGSTIGTGTLTIARLNLGSGAVFTPNLILTDTLSKTGAAGTTLTGTIDLGGATRTFDVAAGTAPELTANGVISNGTLTKTGNGTLVLGVVNSLGTVNANGGTLRVGVLGAIPNGGAVNTGAGGTLDLNGLQHTFTILNNSGTTTTGNKPLTVNALNGASTGVLNMGGSQLTLDDGGNGAYAGSITGVGTVVVKQGGGIAALSGLNTHTGGTVVNAGRLDVSGTPGGTLGTTVNAGAVLQFTNTANGTFHVNGGILSSTTGNNPVNGDLFFDAPSNVHLYNEGNPGAAAEFNLNGTLRGTADFTISSNQGGADGGVGFRLRGIATSDYSGTITLNPAVKLELQSAVGGNFSPLGTGKVKLNAGVASGNLNGSYTQIQTRGNLANSTTTYGNSMEVLGAGIVNFNVLGAANTTAVMGDLKIGADQSMFFNKNDAAIDRTIAFSTVTLTGGNATFSVYDRSFRDNANAFVGPNVQLGAIGHTTPGSGVIFKAQGGDTALQPFPHVTITGVSTYTGPTDIQTGPLSVSFDGSIASSSEIKLSSTTSKFDVLAAFTGYAIPASQKVSGIGDWDGRLLLNGTMAPGLAGIGTLTGDDLAINGGGIMQFELSTADSSSDLLSLTASFEKGTPGNFVFDFEGGGLLGQTYTLVQFQTTTFSATDFTFADLAPGLIGSFLLNPNDLKFVVIPEPASASVLAASLALLLGLRRRRET